MFQRPMNEPVVIPVDQGGPYPFLLRFAIKPEIKMRNSMGNTYLGTTGATGEGESGDYENDDSH